MLRPLLLAVALGWPMSVASASTTPSAEYARQVSTAQIRLAQLEALLVESQLRIEQLEDVIRQQGKNEAAKLENLDQVNAEVVRLRGAIEVLQFETAEIKRVVSEQQIAVERRQLHAEMRLAQLEKLLSVKPPPPPTDADLGLTATAGTPTEGGTPPVPAPAPTAGGTEEAPADMPADAAGKLELAAKHMAEGRNLVARAILEAAIEQHVGAPEMAEIRYRYAETFFNEKDWRRAISKFNEVINNFPDSPWKCWSFYRQGEAFEAMGQGEGAKAFYKGATTDSCKTSDAAKEAKKKL